jgi:hypothetical protein
MSMLTIEAKLLIFKLTAKEIFALKQLFKDI